MSTSGKRRRIITKPELVRDRYTGAITGVGSTSGIRVVIGRWHTSPHGAFADAMVETAAGHRILIAPSDAVREEVCATYRFDEVRVEPIRVSDLPVGWSVTSPSLTLRIEFGGSTVLGRLLGLVPRRIATATWFATLADPVARVLLRGVRTRGSAGQDRREWYGATGMRAVTGIQGSLDGTDLGALGPVDPPCRFGFSSTPRRPSVVDVTTTIER